MKGRSFQSFPLTTLYSSQLDLGKMKWLILSFLDLVTIFFWKSLPPSSSRLLGLDDPQVLEMVEAKSEQPGYADVLGRQTDLWGRVDQGWLVLVDQGAEKSGESEVTLGGVKLLVTNFFQVFLSCSRIGFLVTEGSAN